MHIRTLTSFVLGVTVVFSALLIATAWQQPGDAEPQETVVHSFALERDSDVPPLPFADNPDPTVCGIPQAYGHDNQAWLQGSYEGELIQPVVLLYDSHARRSVKGRIPHGSEVEIILSQTNPVLNYYMVRSVDLEDRQEGWVPAPFVSLEPVEVVN